MRTCWFTAVALAILAPGCSKGAPSPSPATSAAPQGKAGAAAEVERNKPLPSPLPDIAARVNGQPVPSRNVVVFAEQAIHSGQVSADRRPFAYRQALQQLIARELLFQEAASRGITPDDRRLEQAENQARVAYQDDRAWEAFLKDKGMTPAAFRTELRVQHTVQALMAKEAEKVPSTIGDEEAKTFYEGNPQLFESGERLRASHILIRVPEGAPGDQRADAMTKIEGILKRLRSGEDFAKLAQELSQDPGSAGKGGLLADFARGQMVKPFEEAAFALKAGAVSGVVETPFGYHILKLHERLPSERAPFEQVKEQLKQSLVAQKRQQAVNALVKSLQGKARIETFL